MIQRTRKNMKEYIPSKAMELFVENGIDNVSVRDIAKVCEMTPANLYIHFESKEILIKKMFLDGYKSYGSVLRVIAEETVNAEQGLEDMISFLCKMHDEDTMRFRFLILGQHYALKYMEKENPDNPVSILAHMVAQQVNPEDITVKTLSIVGVLVQIATGILYGRLKTNMETEKHNIIKFTKAILNS